VWGQRNTVLLAVLAHHGSVVGQRRLEEDGNGEGDIAVKKIPAGVRAGGEWKALRSIHVS
jgi:hypothetical protein